MKKHISLLLAGLVVAVLFAACTPMEGSIDEVRRKAEGGGIRYTVSFESDGGTRVASQRVKEGELAKKPVNPVRGTDKFVNWFIDEQREDIYTFSAPVTADITLYAKWVDANTPLCFVSFDSKGGSFVDTQPVYKGEKAYKPGDPVLRGYAFDGWYKDDPPTNVYYFSEPVTSDTMTLYAKWTKVTIPSTGTLAEKFAWLSNNALSGEEYTVQANANETLGPQSLSYPGYANITIYLKGGNLLGLTRSISLSGNGSMFTIGDGVTLSLVDYITLQGHSNNNASLVRVNSGGKLIMNNNSTITGNRAANNGGGVYVANESTFIMNGGTISGNTADGLTPRGGGVFVVGRFISLVDPTPGGTFIKTGGTIYGNDGGSDSNKITNSSSIFPVQPGGHAVCVYGLSSTKRRETTAGTEVNLDSGTNDNWGE